MSCRIEGGDFDSAGQATRGLKEQLFRVGVSPAAMRRAMIASYEAEMNVVIHARTGTLWARLDERQLDIEVADEGPGIPDVELALREGWSTASAKAREMGFGAGMGLPNIRRNSDRFDVETRVGRGTRVRSTIFLSSDAPGVEPAPAPALAIDAGRCRRCLRCVRACPTGALRLHAGVPVLREALCIGCMACASECPSGVFGIRAEAGPAGGDPPELRVPAGAVLVVPAAFFASASGRPSPQSVDAMLFALSALGFAEVRLAEEWTDALRAEARRAAAGSTCAPLIAPTCPAVVALVECRFPALISHLGPWVSPLEAAGEEFPLQSVFLVASCPAQALCARRASLTGRLTVLTPARLREALGAPPRVGTTIPRLRAPNEPAVRADGELAVCGPRHVMRVLAAAEAGVLADVAVLDLSLCDHGCSGSPLVCADPFLADLVCRRLQEVRAAMPATDAGSVTRTTGYRPRHGLRLHPDMTTAIRMLGRIDEIARALPGRDCGACGAPGCVLLAEDVVRGTADLSSCPYIPATGMPPSVATGMPPSVVTEVPS